MGVSSAREELGVTRVGDGEVAAGPSELLCQLPRLYHVMAISPLGLLGIHH